MLRRDYLAVATDDTVIHTEIPGEQVAPVYFITLDVFSEYE
jgi:hypothetical protein